MRTVKEMLDKKGREIYFISPNAHVFDALKLMADKNVGALLVMENDNIAGIISERDYARKIVLFGKSSRNVKVSEIMSKNVISVMTNQSAEDCMHLMTDKHIRHLPVLENKKLVGVISIGDVVKAIIDEKTDHIEQLHDYITGRR